MLFFVVVKSFSVTFGYFIKILVRAYSCLEKSCLSKGYPRLIAACSEWSDSSLLVTVRRVCIVFCVKIDTQLPSVLLIQEAREEKVVLS